MGRALPYIHSYIQNSPPEYPDQLRLSHWVLLIMQTTKRALYSGIAMIILHELGG